MIYNRSVHLEFDPESQPHDAAGFAALAAATAPMVGRAAALAAAWTLPPANARGKRRV